MTEKVQNTYKKVTQIQHILLRPDTYVGSISAIEDNMWILHNDEIVYEKIKYVPGLYKIFDEVLVNAADNYQRDHKMTKIEVMIEKNGTITILNDGKGIPVQIHKEHKIYVTEMIFGHLLTSSNYEDDKKKVTGGRNGYGAKLANIFSKQFTVESADSHSKKLLKIEWKNNMSEMTQPLIIPYEGKDYTKITFLPDYERFGLKNLTREMTYLLKKRVYDMAGILKVKVFLNRSLVPIKTFQDYVLLYVKDKENLIFDNAIHSKRWSVMIAKSQGQFQQISFVNGICTTKGGSHVNYITDQIVELLMPNLKRKAKDISIKPFQIKNQMRVFVNCLIQNPSFDSQTKQNLITTVSNFGSVFEVTDKMIKAIQKLGICDMVLNTVRAKQNSKIDKHLKKIKNNKIIIPKLQQANLAGKSDKCTLILTEGDSAKTLAMSGIEKLKRDYYGIYPLKGKVINVRDFSVKQVMDNQQLGNIVKILGLEFGKQYQNTQSLRYGSVMIMADQDIDGSHIKGLVINFFQTFWPSLCKINGFLKQFVTPIIRCKNSTQTVDFFSQTDYELWKINATTDWKIKYYKGLGTSTHSQAKEYFSNLQKHQIEFRYSDENDKQAINLAFNKKCADDRKRWLEGYNYRVNVDYSVKTLKVDDFVNKELIHFSNSDNIRSIPSVIDGLKPSQRKILFACFKRNLRNEIKVAQLAGYVAQHSAYHHGQMSLSQTIIGMAQNYVGSNNLNLLEPIGQFGTRYMNGKDNASPRYIFTNLNPLTRYLFNQADDHIVEYLQEENMSIEPICYIPILPLILINGCEGIGTGWSTTVYPHKVGDVIELIRKRIRKQSHVIKIGWEGFKGEVIMDKPNSYIIKGLFEIEGDTVSITQIPTLKSIRDYKSFLQQRLDSIDNKDPDIEDIKQYHKDGNIHFDITFIEGKQPIDNYMQAYLKLSTNIQENNMVLFNTQQKIQKFATIQDIVEEFYIERIKAYTKRKEYLISRFSRQNEILSSKINFIREVINGHFKMMDKKDAWIHGLIHNNFKSFSQLTKTKSTKMVDYTNQNEQSTNKDYNYLLSMPIWNFCNEKVVELQRTRTQIQQIMRYYEKVSQIQLWQKDLDEFQKVWKIHHNNRFPESERQGQVMVRRRNNSNGVVSEGTRNNGKRGRVVQSSDEEEQEVDARSNKRIPIKQTSRSTRQTGGKKNLMQQQIEQKQQFNAPTKRLKPESQRIIEPIKESNIDSILNKYLVTGSTDGLSLEQRLKIKLSQMQTNFYYDTSKVQNEEQKKQQQSLKEEKKNNENVKNMRVEEQQKKQQKDEKVQKEKIINPQDEQNEKVEQQQKNKDLNEYDWMFHEY